MNTTDNSTYSDRIKNLVTIFDEFNREYPVDLTANPINFPRHWWEQCTERLLQLYNTKTYNIDRADIISGAGGYIYLNERTKEKWCNNLTPVYFSLMYPKILIHLNNKLGLTYTYKAFPELLEDVVTAYEAMFSGEIHLMSYGNSKPIKIWINMCYGMLNSTKSALACHRDMCALISQTGRNMVSTLTKEFIGHCVYTDTDQFYFTNFNEIRNRFMTMAQDKYPYMTLIEEPKCQGIFLNKKKFILHMENGEMKIKGIRNI